MNYDQEITKLVEAIKADKSIIQPWKNYALKELQITQAFVKMGRTTSNLQGPYATTTAPGSSPRDICICSPIAPPYHPDCPVHGL